ARLRQWYCSFNCGRVARCSLFILNPRGSYPSGIFFILINPLLEQLCFLYRGFLTSNLNKICGAFDVLYWVFFASSFELGLLAYLIFILYLSVNTNDIHYSMRRGFAAFAPMEGDLCISADLRF
ncbi:MAG: hypothetical protein RI932_1545, partial [Pseudomonadota bacterium]